MSTTTSPPLTEPAAIGYMVVNSITGASPFVMDNGNYTATFKGLTAPPPGATTAVGLNITNPGNTVSLLSYGPSGSTHQFAMAQNNTPRITFDQNNLLSLQPQGGTVAIGASGQTGDLVVRGSASVMGDTSADTLSVQKSLTISGASGATANTLLVDKILSVSGATAGTLNAGTGTITVSQASGATLNAGAGTITVGAASAGGLNAGTGTITVSQASGATLNAGTGTINAQSVHAGNLDAGTGTITITGASAGQVSAGSLVLGDATFSPTALPSSKKGVEVNNALLLANGGFYTAEVASFDGGATFKSSLSSIDGSITLGGPTTPATTKQLSVFGTMQLGATATISPTALSSGKSAVELKDALLMANEGLYTNKPATFDGGATFKSNLTSIEGNINLGGPFTKPTDTLFSIFGSMQVGNNGTISPSSTGISVGGDLNVNGSISINGNSVINSSGTGSSSVKSFIIQHPKEEDKFLVHATIEGPENAVFYRGTAQLTNGRAEVTLPDYFESLTKPEDRTISLSNVDGFDLLAIETVKGEQIHEGRFTVISQNAASSQAFNWEVKAVRKDVEDLKTEPLKDELTVMSFGPYTFGTPIDRVLN